MAFGAGLLCLPPFLPARCMLRGAYCVVNATCVCCVFSKINAHSLFSKWFSESGKLVMKLFTFIQELIADEDALICVLIDEASDEARHDSKIRRYENTS